MATSPASVSPPASVSSPKPAPSRSTPVTTEDLESDIAQLREDISQLAKQLAATGEHSYGAAKRAAAEGVSQLKAQGEAAVQNVKANAADMEAQLVASVREKPVTSLAIAAAAGFLFALLSRR